MFTAILKSPVFLDQRASATVGASADPAMSGAAGGAGGEPAVAARPDPMLAIEARLRAEIKLELQADFDARWEFARDEAHKDGYQAGLVEGHQEGLDAAHAAFRKKQALIEQVLQKVETEAQAWHDAVHDQAHGVARQALCELLGENALSAAFLDGLISRVTHNLRTQDILSVRVHPSEGRLLREACVSRGEMVATGALVDRLVDDIQLEAGGLVVETPRGSYQATFDTLLRKLLSLVDQQRSQLSNLESVPHVRLA